MKLSHHALSFLLAQYRAIFKRAYIKGLASAVLLTASIGTTAAADPATVTDLSALNQMPGDTINFHKDQLLQLQVSGDSLTLNKNLNITLNQAADTGQSISANGTADTAVTLEGQGKDITIKGATAGAAFTFGSTTATSKLKINNLGTLSIDNATVNLETSGGQSIQAGVDIGAAEVIIRNGATVNLNNNIGAAANVANTFLRGTKMTVEGAKTVVNIGNPEVSGSTTSSWNTKAVFGYEEEYDQSGKLKYSGSHTTINDATINFYGAVVAQTTTGSLGYAARIQAKTLEANNAVFNVKDFGLTSGNHGAGATYNVHESTLTNS